jgi:hypothetical protein
MRTNGGCRCFKELPTAKRIYVERLFQAQLELEEAKDGEALARERLETALVELAELRGLYAKTEGTLRAWITNERMLLLRISELCLALKDKP